MRSFFRRRDRSRERPPPPVGGFLETTAAGAYFADKQSAQHRVRSRLGRAGFFFTATERDASEMDLLKGPKQFPEHQPFVPQGEYPNLYSPEVLGLIAGAALGVRRSEPLRVHSIIAADAGHEAVRKTGGGAFRPARLSAGVGRHAEEGT